MLTPALARRPEATIPWPTGVNTSSRAQLGTATQIQQPARRSTCWRTACKYCVNSDMTTCNCQCSKEGSVRSGSWPAGV
eukprot:365661-Chlamydomonas_euryale.AAC.89